MEQTGGMDSGRFVEKWSKASLSERAASHEHFIDLCKLIGVETPASADGSGEDYCFEKHVQVVGPASKSARGERGFVDVWKRGCFAWEYKQKDKYKDLTEAFRQLYQYRDALDNPPLSVVCDIESTVIHTHFTGYPRTTETIRLAEIPSRLHVLKRVFTDPDSFRRTLARTDDVTKQVADEFKGLADNLIDRLTAPQTKFTGQAQGLTLLAPGFHHHHEIAHFLMKLIFCLFAEDIGLLPADIFTRLVNRCLIDPESFVRRASELFALMRTGGEFGNDAIPWFNGGLFDDKPAVPLTHGNLLVLQKIAQKNWAGIEPSIFGTLFERLLDPSKRAQIGAHYTSKEDILLVVEPVVMAPLRREWEAVKEETGPGIEAYAKESNAKKRAALRDPVQKRFESFRKRLGEVSILDPACGSGNFLYVALRSLLDLDDEVARHAASLGLYLDPRPHVRPTQMHGIEINPYAAELAQVVIWIGYLQWLKDRGIEPAKEPILDKLNSIEERDAILDLSDAGNPRAAKWPKADFIIGNPPFLGSKLFRKNGLSDEYVQAMFKAYGDHKGEAVIPRTSDLCCYWFEQARRALEGNKKVRVGLLATQGIRGKENRTVLERIKETGDIFMAWTDKEWTLEGAAVHVSIVGFGANVAGIYRVNGESVATISSNLRSDIDTTIAKMLPENQAVPWSIGTQKGGSFEFDVVKARELLSLPNPTARKNSDVVRPWRNGSDITDRLRGLWIVDFGPHTKEDEAAVYEAPFEYVRKHVKPERDGNRRDSYREKWWIHQEARGELRDVLRTPKLMLTPRIAKHRLWIRTTSDILPDCAVVVIARADDYFFGVLQSSIHSLWSLRQGTQLETRPRYTPTTCFETFPLPWAPGKEDVKHAAYKRISAAAKALDEQRERWLNPPEWVAPLAARVDEGDDFSDVPEEARGLVRASAIAAACAKDARLKKRTLTNLYNERPTWLRLAHLELDRAVLLAYRLVDEKGGWEESWAEVWEEKGAGSAGGEGRRGEVERLVLEGLLRLNLERCGGEG